MQFPATAEQPAPRDRYLSLGGPLFCSRSRPDAASDSAKARFEVVGGVRPGNDLQYLP
jgi:hypothetical protein